NCSKAVSPTPNSWSKLPSRLLRRSSKICRPACIWSPAALRSRSPSPERHSRSSLPSQWPSATISSDSNAPRSLPIEGRWHLRAAADIEYFIARAVYLVLEINKEDNMCDQDHFEKDRQEYEALGLVTRKQFGVLLGAGVAMMLPRVANAVAVTESDV